MSNTNGNSCPVPVGTLLIIGGKESKGEMPQNHKAPDGYDPLEVLRTFSDLLPKHNVHVEIVTSGSSQGDESFREYKKLFKKLGIEDVAQIHHDSRKEALDDDLEERIKIADGIFFTGGDQLLLTSFYGGTPFLTMLKGKYIKHKIVIAGTSAGAMALSTPMIYSGSQEEQQITNEIKVTVGLEFLKDVCIDTHFVHRGRLLRLAQVIATNPTAVGVGIDEDTALIIRNGLEAEIVGSGVVVILEGYDISYTNVDGKPDQPPLSMRDIRMHILAHQDKYCIRQTNPPHI